MEMGEAQRALLDPVRWGLPPESELDLGERLERLWNDYREWMRTRTRDGSAWALCYLKGLLLMERQRNFTNIVRRVLGPEHDGQRLQHFMSESPWNAHGIFWQMQEEIAARPELAGGMLSLDDSGEERSGPQSAGASRQYIGRLGKVEMGQVMVALSYSKGPYWLMVEAEPYLPREWFSAEQRQKWKRLGIPEERAFATKQQLGLGLIRLVRGTLPFEVVGCDSAYGRDGAFRAALDSEGTCYMADVPADTRLFVQKPTAEQPAEPIEVREALQRLAMTLEPLEVRHSERGPLSYECAARRLWTLRPDGTAREEWLFVRRETDGKLSFSLSNAPPQTPLSTLARWRCERYFVERTFQDSKSELGWDELEARKYPAWLHHTALTALALWFIAQTKLDWAKKYPPDSALAQQLQVEVLPALSVANVREMLRATMPLQSLSPEESRRLVARHLLNRTRSTSSRTKKKRRKHRET
jgi:SRSO17 transposase